jgi:cysteine synthase
MLATRARLAVGRATALTRSFSVSADVTRCIGNTPLVQLNRVIGPDCKAKRVLAKLEMQNPGGSVKDRIALSMIEKAEARGEIHPSRTTIVEATSGNTGIGLAMVSAAKGYKCIIIMPQLPPMRERYIICRKFGAHVHLTAGAVGAPMVQNMFAHLTTLLESDPNFWCPRQFENKDNVAVHLETTGPEVWDQTGGEIDYFVAGAGTGGTIAGAGRYLQERNPSLINVCVEPTESRVLAGTNAAHHRPHATRCLTPRRLAASPRALPHPSPPRRLAARHPTMPPTVALRSAACGGT